MKEEHESQNTVEGRVKELEEQLELTMATLEKILMHIGVTNDAIASLQSAAQPRSDMSITLPFDVWEPPEPNKGQDD